MKKKYSLFAVIMFSALLLVGHAHAEKDSNNSESDVNKQKEKSSLGLLIGYNFYRMIDFNNKLSSEGNNTIDGGLNIAVEFSPGDIDIPWFGRRIQLPTVGLEYLGANSKTTHIGTGGSATVDWKLPVLGTYFAPIFEITPIFESENRKLLLSLRPGIGYYALGKFTDANLTINDRPGSLEVSDDTISFFAKVGVKYIRDKYEVFLEGGYRYLKFNSVSQIPKDGFTETVNGPLAQPSKLAEALDYSGSTINIVISTKF